MNTINAKWGTVKADLGILGRVGEANCTQIVWDVSTILTEWADAKILCIVQRAGDTEPYIASIAESGNNRILVLSAVELAKEGKTTIELRATKDDVVSKSAYYTGRVMASLQGEGDKPSEPIADVLNQLEERVEAATESLQVVDEVVTRADTAVTKAETATKSAETAITDAQTAITTANTAANNAQSVADAIKAAKDAGEFNGKDGAKGDTGADGKDGADGISPTVTTSKTGDTTTVTITDKDGAHVATIKDGAKGADGAKGDDGADGFSPSVKVTKSGNTATITATDKDGTTSAEVKDGADAELDKQGIIDALGYEPAAEEGEIELIQSITLTEAATVEFSGFSLDYAYCESILPAQTTISGGTFQFYTKNAYQRASYIGGANTATDSVRTAWAEARRYGGRYFFIHSSYTSISDGQMLRHTSYALNAKTIKAEPIIKVRYTPTCPVGTIVNLYGIRAK